MPLRTARWLAVAFAILGLPSYVAAAQADEPDPLDRWSLSVGGLRAVSDTTITARAGVDEYTAEGSFNLEDDLGLDSRQPVAHVRMDVLTTPERGQGLSLEYFGFDRENEVGIERSIVYEGYTYEASARVRGRLDYDFASAAYRWWYGDGATVWGLGAGLAYYRVDTLLEGEATFDGDSVYAATRSSDAAFAPLLALGWRHAFDDRWRVYADLSGVAKEGGALTGHIIDAGVGVEWFPWRRLGVALEYGHTKIRLTREREYWDARLDLTLRGPSLFLRLR